MEANVKIYELEIQGFTGRWVPMKDVEVEGEGLVFITRHVVEDQALELATRMNMSVRIRCYSYYYGPRPMKPRLLSSEVIETVEV